jgi:hypothetical protein
MGMEIHPAVINESREMLGVTSKLG